MNCSQICWNSLDLIAGTRTSQKKRQLQLWKQMTFPSSLRDIIMPAVWMDMLRDVKFKPFIARLLLTSQSQSQNRQWLPCRLSDDLNCWCWHSVCTSRQCYFHLKKKLGSVLCWQLRMTLCTLSFVFCSLQRHCFLVLARVTSEVEKLNWSKSKCLSRE